MTTIIMGEIYIQYEYWFAALQLIFAMLGMGATLTVSDFSQELKTPKGVIAGCVIQIIIVPLTALLMIHLFGLMGGIAIGLALIAAIPGGTTSNIFTFMAVGNSALSIAITAITTLACLVTTPLILSFLITEYLPASFSMPRNQIMREIAFTLLVPLIIGMQILRYLPSHAPRVSKWSIRLSLIGILFIVIGSASAGRLNIEAFGVQNTLTVVIFISLLSLLCYFISRLIKLTRQDSTAIEMEVIVRNINLGVLIKASLFPASAALSNTTSSQIGDIVLFTILLYGAIQLLIAAVMIIVKRRTHQVTT